MTTNYSAARESGLLPPFAACVAAWKSSPTIGQQIKTLHPSGAALLFAAAYLAGQAGSLVAPLVVAAFLAGLFLVKTIQTENQIMKTPIFVAPPSPPQQPSADSLAGYPLRDQLAGLVVREMKLGQPVANGKAPKITTVK